MAQSFTLGPMRGVGLRSKQVCAGDAREQGSGHRLIRVQARQDAPSDQRRRWPTSTARRAVKTALHEESRPMTDEHQHPSDFVMLPVEARDFILQALKETTQQLSKTNRLRATRHILVEEGVKLTKQNSFTIDHRDQLLLMSLAARLLTKTQE
jgi:hypothetical protein